MKSKTLKEKILWNEAIKAATNENKRYDGTIPNDTEREAMAYFIGLKLSYKRGVPNSPTKPKEI